MSRSRSARASAALILFAAVSALFTAAFADPVHQKIRVGWPTAGEAETIRSLPDLEIMEARAGESLTLLSTPELTAALEEAGLRPEILADPYGAFHLMSGGRAWPGLGDFISYDEAGAYLDSMHALYPSITTAKDSIGTTWEDRPIWAIKISDNPEIDEEEPEVLLDALHHAREPIGVSVVLSFLSYLCDNYGADPEATFLVNEREIWIVPVVNPDGYVYNETVSSDLMWRKNRRDNPGPDEGVDLNRNYDANFGGAGSSPDYDEQTYHGPYAFSEPETQAMRDFILARDFVTHDSYHSVAAMILYPWGYLGTPTPDDFAFSGLGLERARDNEYDVMQIWDFYAVSGSTCDWAYAEKGIISYATEVGGSHFWPQESEIPGLVAENLYSNIALVWNAGSRARLVGVAVDPAGNGRLDPGETADLVLTLDNPCWIAAATGVTATLSSDNAYLQLADPSASFGDIAVRDSADNAADPFSIAVDAAAPSGLTAEIAVRIEWEGCLWEETLTLTIGEPTVIVSDDFESGNAGWSADPIQNASTGAFVLIDPNPTEYQPGDDHTPAPGTIAWITGQNSSLGVDDVDGGTAAIRSPVWDLSGYERVGLSLAWFHGQRDPGDDAEDGFAVELSNDGGATYPAALVSIGDVNHQPNWSVLDVELNDYLPLTDQMRLRVRATDGPSTGDIVEGGFDDLMIFSLGPDDDPPSAPVPLSPADGATALPAAPLTVQNAVDPEGSPLTYGFFVYADSFLTDRVRAATGVVEGTGETVWIVDPPLGDGTYWWRAFAEDTLRRGPLSPARSFAVDQATAVDVAGDAVAAFALLPARPNPSVGETAIRFLLPREGRVRADVFDAAGRAVRNLVRGHLAAGPQTITWDGRDSRGRETPAGVYFVRIRTEREDRSVKVVRVR